MHIEARAVLNMTLGWIVIVTQTISGDLISTQRIPARDWDHAKRIAEVINKG